MTREPGRVIAVAAAIVVAIAVQLLASGLVTSDQGTNALHFVVVITPLVANELSRLFTTPTAAPVLERGTPVTTPSGQPAIVSGASPNQP